MNKKLKELQKIQFDMLVTLDNICKKHGIKIYLTGGTLLGAVRHKGFIPWDDDIDVVITREDCNKLEKIINKELPKEYTFNSLKDDNYNIVFCKMFKNNTLCVEKYAEKVQMNKGIWIDIFVLDKISNNNIAAKIHYHRVKFYRYLLIIKSGFLLKSNNKIFIFLFNIIKFIIKPLSITGLKRKLINLITKYDNYNSSRRIVYGGSKYYLVDEKEIANASVVLFNDKKFYTFMNPDKYLFMMYGNYMELPPKDKRVPHDLSHIVFDTRKGKEK